MKINKIVSVCLVLILSLCLMVAPAFALAVSPGDRIILKATNRQGVPLHETSAPSLIGRAATGTFAEVLETAADSTWLKVKLPDNNERWVVSAFE